MARSELIGSSPKFREVLAGIDTVAPVNCAVLLRGETGTGKEVIAQAIHDAGPRRHNRFVALNCAAVPSGLLESELFGHERGAFTGAVTQVIGRFQAADRGTLFLDEIGDLPLELQPKLCSAAFALLLFLSLGECSVGYSLWSQIPRHHCQWWGRVLRFRH